MNMDDFKSIILKDLERLREDECLEEFSKRLIDYERLSFKDSQLSNEARDEGNQLFAQSNLTNMQLHEVLCIYHESLGLAPANSEARAKVYANKAAVLLRMRKYREAIIEAEKALKITKSNNLRIKLLCRKAESLAALGSSESRSCLEKAKFILNKSEDCMNVKAPLMKTLERVQVAVDEEKLDTPKVNKRKIEVSKMIADAEKKNIWSSVKVKESEKYGRHLVAAQDFKPGEIILVEKPYMYNVKESRALQYCYKCSNYLWTAVPCEYCCLRMFCSEECRNEAWSEFHDIECSVVSKMKFVIKKKWNDLIPFILSIFFKALKEAGCIKKLQADFQSLKYGDPGGKGLSYRIIIASPTRGFSERNLEIYTSSSTLTLVSLARFTTIFGKTYKFDEIDKLMKNDVAMFTGALLLKFGACIATAGVCIRLIDPIKQDGSEERFDSGDEVVDNGSKIPVFNILAMLTTVGCIPNVLSCRTIDHKFVMFALQPIKEGTRLIAYDRSFSSIYSSGPKSERQSMHQNYYKCSCDCRACIEDWPVKLEDLHKVIVIVGPKALEFGNFREELDSITEQWDLHQHAHKPNYPDIKSVNKLKTLVAQAWEYYSLPSHTLVFVTSLMVQFLEQFFSPDKNIFTSS